MIPPPFAAASSAAPVPNSKFLSSTDIVVELTIVWVPLTVKLPEIMVSSAIVVVPPAESSVRLPEVVVTVFAFNERLSTVAAPVTASVVPSNVRFPESSSAPDVPARTTLLSVRSETVAEERTVSPPAMLAPPSASIAPLISTVPVNVDIPETFSVVAST